MTVRMQAGHKQLALNTATGASLEKAGSVLKRVSEMPRMLMTARRGTAPKKRPEFVLVIYKFYPTPHFCLCLRIHILSLSLILKKNIKHESIN